MSGVHNYCMLDNDAFRSSTHRYQHREQDIQWRIQDCSEGVRFLAQKSDDLFSRHTLDAHVRFKLNSSKPVSATPTFFLSP